MQLIFTCEKCKFRVEAWDDGNPYRQIGTGEREYFYHPSPPPEPPRPEDLVSGGVELEVVFGNASDKICMDCCEISKIDEERDELKCPECDSKRLVETFEIGEEPCPKCGGAFGPAESGGIS